MFGQSQSTYASASSLLPNMYSSASMDRNLANFYKTSPTVPSTPVSNASDFLEGLMRASQHQMNTLDMFRAHAQASVDQWYSTLNAMVANTQQKTPSDEMPSGPPYFMIPSTLRSLSTSNRPTSESSKSKTTSGAQSSPLKFSVNAILNTETSDVKPKTFEEAIDNSVSSKNVTPQNQASQNFATYMLSPQNHTRAPWGGLGAEPEMDSFQYLKNNPFAQAAYNGLGMGLGMPANHLAFLACLRGKPRRGILRRAVFSDTQRKGLEKMFLKQKYISKPDRRKLATKLGLKDSQVKIWFQNRRMKWRNSKEREVLYSKEINTTNTEQLCDEKLNEAKQSLHADLQLHGEHDISEEITGKYRGDDCDSDSMNENNELNFLKTD